MPDALTMRSGDRNQCPTCHKYFNSTSAFDRHRTGKVGTKERRCMTTEEMEAKKMCLNAAGFWIRNKANPFVRASA
jgi:hypothetical protein